MTDIELSILRESYWVHYKYAKDLSLTLPLEHPKRVKLEEELNKMIKEMNTNGITPN